MSVLIIETQFRAERQGWSRLGPYWFDNREAAETYAKAHIVSVEFVWRVMPLTKYETP